MDNNTKLNTSAAIVAIAMAAAMLVAGPAHAALQDRDLNGDSVVDTFYDTDLDITWLRDADVNGQMDWDTAMAWAEGYSLGGYSDWRLPTSDTCEAQNCTGSEMGHLWYVELGNSAGAMTNVGDFQNLTGWNYWSGTKWAVDASAAWNFYAGTGEQYAIGKLNEVLAMAVRDGDVATVPEPATYALMLAGLGALALSRRQQRS